MKKMTTVWLDENDRERIKRIQARLEKERTPEKISLGDAIRYALAKAAGNGDKQPANQ